MNESLKELADLLSKSVFHTAIKAQTKAEVLAEIADILVAGGTQVSREMAKETGLDATFGRGTKGIHVVNAMVKTLRSRGAA